MTKTELINKWGTVGGRVQFDHTEEFEKDLDSYLEESRLAENLVIKADSQAAPNGEDEEMYLNMQYYHDYCHMNGYITPQDWLLKHKHF